MKTRESKLVRELEKKLERLEAAYSRRCDRFQKKLEWTLMDLDSLAKTQNELHKSACALQKANDALVKENMGLRSSLREAQRDSGMEELYDQFRELKSKQEET